MTTTIQAATPATETKIFLVCPKYNVDATYAYVQTLDYIKLTKLPVGMFHLELPADEYTAHKKALLEMADLYKGERLEC
jgi:hypothetical protein